MVRVYAYLSDNVLELRGLEDTITGQPVKDATVSVTLDHVTGEPITGASWPMPMAHVGGGTYRAVLPKGLEVRIGCRLAGAITAVSGSVQRTWPLTVWVREIR